MGTGGRSGGGFSQLEEMAKMGEILIHVYSNDVDADLKKAELLGAKIVSPKQVIPGVGWFDNFEDLTGNRIALYTSMDPLYNNKRSGASWSGR